MNKFSPKHPLSILGLAFIHSPLLQWLPVSIKVIAGNRELKGVDGVEVSERTTDTGWVGIKGTHRRHWSPTGLATDGHLYCLQIWRARGECSFLSLEREPEKGEEGCSAGALAPGPRTELLSTCSHERGSQGNQYPDLITLQFSRRPAVPPTAEPCGKLGCEWP